MRYFSCLLMLLLSFHAFSQNSVFAKNVFASTAHSSPAPDVIRVYDEDSNNITVNAENRLDSAYNHNLNKLRNYSLELLNRTAKLHNNNKNMNNNEEIHKTSTNNKIIHTERIENIDLSKLISANTFASPLRRKLHITSKYGYRFHPVQKEYKFHSGVDLRAKNEPVYAICSGKIISSSYDDISGNYLKLRTSNDIIFVYCHLSKTLFNVGDYVSVGTPIGISGSTGSTTAPHLHLSIIVNGKHIDPIPFLAMALNN